LVTIRKRWRLERLYPAPRVKKRGTEKKTAEKRGSFKYGERLFLGRGKKTPIGGGGDKVVCPDKKADCAGEKNRPNPSQRPVSEKKKDSQGGKKKRPSNEGLSLGERSGGPGRTAHQRWEGEPSHFKQKRGKDGEKERRESFEKKIERKILEGEKNRKPIGTLGGTKIYWHMKRLNS